MTEPHADSRTHSRPEPRGEWDDLSHLVPHDPHFALDLATWGPNREARPPSLAAAQTYCRRLTYGHYENFPVGTLLLPQALRRPFEAVYAFCRWADDLGDEVTDADASLRLLGWWRGELESCFEGRAQHPVYVALQPVIESHALRSEPFHDLIDAFEQDQIVREYETFEQLHDYCTRSANPVGRIVLRLCDADTDENIVDADSICTGLQLANFWQDVARDQAIGRVYVPREDRERFGVNQEDWQSQRSTDAFRDLMKFEVDRARRFLRDGLPLIPRLPGRLQVEIDAFVGGGMKICERIESIGYRVWETRPVVRKRDMARVVAKAMLRALVRRTRLGGRIS